MSSVTELETGLMPDLNSFGADEIDRIDWHPLDDLRSGRELAPGAALAEQG
jgi:hypothetical protein